MQRSSFSLIWFLFSFEGRIGRLAYWMFSLGAVVTIFSVLFVIGYLFGPEPGATAQADPVSIDPAVGVGIAIGFFVVLVLWSWIGYAVLAKRWHDRDKSGWWSLIGFVPYIGGIWMLVECGFLKGTEGPNRFGEHPRGMRPEQLATVFE